MTGSLAHCTEIFSSSFAAAAYLEKNPLLPGKKVYVVGHEGICDELDLLKIPHIGGPEDAAATVDMSLHGKVVHDPAVGAVVVGLDKNINYYKIQYAQLCINENPGCLFIATNLDEVAHLTSAQKWAGGGAMVGAIKGCTGREPILVGKPAPLMVDYLVGKYGYDKRRMCMVGDRLDTDILFGLNNGLQTVLTLSGVTSEKQVFSAEHNVRPHFIVDSIADLL
jgi:phosphoglycolate/pyridoxal phosphate phosphatase family enzyme